MTENGLLAVQLRTYGCVVSCESELHDAIAKMLDDIGVAYEREYRLDAHDRPDFWLPDNRVAIEAKVDGSSTEVARQLKRYASHDVVRDVILVTTRARHNAVPDSLSGKPVHVVNVGSPW